MPKFIHFFASFSHFLPSSVDFKPSLLVDVPLSYQAYR
ncbi:hypothetical protein VIBHAR_06127 [Vibrio campbellii ATCC BAA-1116]|uniref:Uncharacterized protein n=1 Tax=Vibrio campbellii (strain ATCC BAA-1116) TaxID=2902295 RepID=A7N762_VIBC1|nr:hypothetical protein VIBHAR_06127 [Vibrio campbellii ATCC BAA-1116]